mgnify:CR=1 FL=1
MLYPSETAAVELIDGRVLFNMRSESDAHRRLISISPDGVTGWSEPTFDDALLEPQCMASMMRYSWPTGGGRSRILFSNPDTLERTQPGDDRAVAVDSRDAVASMRKIDGRPSRPPYPCGRWRPR